MKNLRFKKLFLLSHRERKAREENLDFPVIVVQGSNDVGKSHLIKSLYAAFGADPNVVNVKWKDANPIVMLDFSVNAESYSIMRVNDQVALFDKSGNILWSGSSIVREIGPNLAELFDFQVQLATKAGAIIVPPPQFCFLPFYQDQDRGWDDGWGSFKGLAMLPEYKKSILDYHSGIRPREYYLAKALKAEAARHQAELRAERDALERASKRLRRGRKNILFPVGPDEFAQQITRLLDILNQLNSDYETIRRDISELQSRRATLTEQIEVANETLRELDADYGYLAKLVQAEITCPTCHAIYENDFANRFGLIGDIDECQNLLIEAKQALVRIDQDIASRQKSFLAVEAQKDEIDSILSSSVSEISLDDVLRGKSEQMIDGALDDEVKVIQIAMNIWLEKERGASDDMARFEDVKRKKKIMRFYADKLREFSEKLGVVFSPSVSKSLYPKINETGSYGTRAFLAYMFAVIHTISEYSSSVIAPIVLDTPLQQDQDKDNAESILEFIRDYIPNGIQLVLGTVSLHGVRYPGYVIEPKVELSLMNSGNYETVSSHISPYYNQMLSLGIEGGELL